MNIVEIANERYATKHYNKVEKISDTKIEQLLTILRNSPSSVNIQPWHFFVVGNNAAKNKIISAITDFNQPRITDSSHTIIFCMKTTIDDDFLQTLLDQEEADGRFPSKDFKKAQDKGRRSFVKKNNSTPQSLMTWESNQLYIALGQLLFAAKAIGIDSTPIEGFDSNKMDKILGLKEKGLKSVVVVALGYHSDNDGNADRPKSRLPAEKIFTFL